MGRMDALIVDPLPSFRFNDTNPAVEISRQP